MGKRMAANLAKHLAESGQVSYCSKDPRSPFVFFCSSAQLLGGEEDEHRSESSEG